MDQGRPKEQYEPVERKLKKGEEAIVLYMQVDEEGSRAFTLMTGHAPLGL